MSIDPKQDRTAPDPRERLWDKFHERVSYHAEELLADLQKLFPRWEPTLEDDEMVLLMYQSRAHRYGYDSLSAATDAAMVAARLLKPKALDWTIEGPDLLAILTVVRMTPRPST
jgi:hypothetical protein